MNTKTEIIDSLITIGAVKFGTFTLKSGIQSPIYIDLRIVVSFPDLLKKIALAMKSMAVPLQFDRVAGIPYTALPIATAFSLETGCPMIYSRKEQKQYGTGQQIEGIWKEKDRVLIIDDLITNGASKQECFDVFENCGMVVSDVIVLIDREQGGKQRIEKNGYTLFALISIFEILERMLSKQKVTQEKYKEIYDFLNLNSSL